MKTLHVGRGVEWPAELASQAVGVLGMRGAGKSNAGRVYAEELFAAGIPFVVFDPIGNWHGIRAGRDGKPSGGIPIPIFGGEHGDLPLDRASGQKIADLVIERRLSCVLDLSHADFSETDKRRFLVEFGDRLFRKKSRESGWLTLVMEEADDYAPQSSRGAIAECLGMFQRLVKRGRFKGLGAFLITQRSAAINKDLLYMVGTLLVFRTTGPRDQEAIGGWVKHNAIGEKVLESLPALEDGEAWVIAQEALGSIARVRFRHMHTYDTGATPEHGHGGGKPVTLADIDVPALSKELQAAIEKAKADDPRELRKRIQELERALKAQPAPKPVPPPKPAPSPLKAEHVKRIEKAIAQAGKVAASLDVVVGKALARSQAILDAATGLQVALGEAARAAAFGTPPAGRGIEALIPNQMPPAKGRATEASANVTPAPFRGRPAVARPSASASSNGDIGKGERITLVAIAQHGDAGVTREQLTVLTGYKRSSRDAYLQRLRAGGYIDQTGDAILATDAGVAALGPDFEPLPTGEELRRYWMERLPEGERRVLHVAVQAYPDSIERASIDEATGYRRSSRDAYIQRLGARRLVTMPRGAVRASDELF
jgi:hypothetical protein